MSVTRWLQEKKAVIEKELQDLLYQEDTLLFRAMQHAVLSGGKRYRPLLAMASGEVLGVREEALLPYACALELIHNYSLVHDDLPAMDNDSFRRGKPACHVAFGEDIAILAGDCLLTLAFEIMTETRDGKVTAAQREQSIKEISRAAGYRGMVGGQLLDITLAPAELSDGKMNELIQKKTGALITVSARIGGILGNADENQMRALTEYGQNLGLAFQTRDDILDSLQDTSDKRPFRPNSVHLWGLENARQRLEEYVKNAVNALEREDILSGELARLASLLLNDELENTDE